MPYEPKHCEIVTGDLLAAPDTMIVHQCNCTSTGQAGGIARLIFDRFPFADCYTEENEREPGTAAICVAGPEKLTVVNLFGQHHPGGPSEEETPDQRFDWFKQALNVFGNALLNLRDEIWAEEEVTIAFPWQIGCGIAGGDWDGRYLPLIDKFAEALAKHNIKVRIYRLPE